MFNLQGSEIIVILLLALVVLGPEKLPDAIRKFSQAYSEFRKMGSGFQSELKSALDEPMREMRETADLVQRAADPARIAEEAENEAELRAAADAAAATASTENATDKATEVSPADAVDEVPVASTAYLPARLRVQDADPEPANGKKVNQIALSMARGPIEPDVTATAESDGTTGSVADPDLLTGVPEGAAAMLAPPSSGTEPAVSPPPPPSVEGDDADQGAS